MKFLKSHRVEYTDRLFQGKFRYKIVISSGLAGWFRGGKLSKIKLLLENGDYYARNATIAEKKFVKKLVTILEIFDDWQVRVETPCISLYLNDLINLETIVKASSQRIKYVSIPDPASENKLVNQTILVKKLDYDYRVTVGSSNQCYLSFVQWCENNPKIRLPKRAKKDLSRDSNPGGGYFYVKDDKSLTLVKMFLGRTITKVENVVRA